MAFKLMEFIQNVTKLNKTTLDTFQNNIKDEFDKIEAGTQNITYDNTTSGLEATTVKGAIDELASGKQNTLTAGDNITIENGVISATGGGTGSINYSTEEIEVGVWTDGKKIYQKTIQFTTSESQISVETGITNLDKCIDLSGNTNGKPINYFLLMSGQTYFIQAQLAGNTIVHSCSSAYANQAAHVTLLYTKTTAN